MFHVEHSLICYKYGENKVMFHVEHYLIYLSKVVLNNDVPRRTLILKDICLSNTTLQKNLIPLQY